MLSVVSAQFLDIPCFLEEIAGHRLSAGIIVINLSEPGLGLIKPVKSN